MCTQTETEGHDSRARAGFHSPLGGRSSFNPQTQWFRVIRKVEFNTCCTPATDGISGRYRGLHILDVGDFGQLSWGVQYTYFGFQPIGRWGVYNWGQNLFYPHGDWVYAEHSL